ncbi:ABC transporter permease [Paenibacillus nanensis]|uniref:ABC transporter permease n=1 Tax=Paenibacillus nanensis TaxID=393251 RepID=A0A3A1UUB0_9BACL|nr:ABC transporter permease [Paenibacillus nanensis]RIX52077.1 ABC transporter permease [Paenibacillus nanensis]
MTLWLKLVRDMKQSIGQFIAFVLIIAVGAFFYAGLVTYSNTLSGYSEDYFEKHNLSDLSVYYERISQQDAARLSEIEGIAKIEGRYTVDAVQTFEDGKAALKLHSIPAQNEINTPALTEGRLPSGRGEILVDSHYAKEHQLGAGDPIRVSAGDKSLTFTISGLGENAEYAKKNDTQDHKSYGVAYVAEAAIPEIAGGFFYNEVLVDAKDGYDPDQIGESIAVKSEQEQLPYVGQLSKERSFSYSKINETIYNNGLMSRVIPFVLFVIEAVILYLAMSRILDAQRKQVGIMKALGVKNSSIMLHYMGYPVLASLAGSILGCVIADLVFIPFVTESSARAYSLPGITFSLSYLSIIPPFLFSSVFGMLSCYLSGRALLKERAAQAMRPKPPKKMKKLLIERVPGIWRPIPYRYKLILKNILLNKKKALASSIGVIVSTVLLVTALGTQTSLLKVAGQAEEVYHYDLRADYKAGASADLTNLPSGIAQSYPLSAYPVEFVKADETEKATLIVTETDNELIHFFDEQENRISLEDSGVLVPKSYADKYNIAEGDVVTLRFTDAKHEHKTAEMKVLDISTQYANPSFYCTPAYLKSFGIEVQPTSLLVAAGHSAAIEEARAFFEQDERVQAVTDKSDLERSAQYIVQQNSFVFIMFIVCAVILSFGAIYTISSINIYERSRELATLKVLGYQKHKINKLIFLENIILTTFAVIIALPVSGYFFDIIIAALSSSHQQIPDQIHITTLAAAVIFAFVLTLVSNVLLRGKVTRINMIESLKSIE